ncbi:putative C6 transcription factor [Leptodontidium sp. MPI-SDFR-AT-0119]|nr:putative C6 transcription factor [Leptodontidium sp. MPI-SDFR-AT-0119]
MAKLKNPTKTPNTASSSQQPGTRKINLSELKKNNDIWYKIKVLIYDLANIKNDPASVTRLERTVDELYISEPYFTAEQAELVKSTLVHFPPEPDEMEEDYTEGATEEFQIPKQPSKPAEIKGEMKTETVEEAIKRRMVNFYDKRKASGDFRPCGTHDMVPVYLGVFGILKGELEDEKFLGRLRKARIERETEASGVAGGGGKETRNEKGKKGR